jgi:hypothetical protein
MNARMVRVQKLGLQEIEDAGGIPGHKKAEEEARAIAGIVVA